MIRLAILLDVSGLSRIALVTHGTSTAILRTIIAATSFALVGYWNSDAKSASASDVAVSPPVITETCLSQDKLPCATLTVYLPDPDGSNGVKIVVAHPFTSQITNSQNLAFFAGEDLAVPPDTLPTTNGFLSLPSGASVILPKGSGVLSRGQLIAIQNLPPSVPSYSKRPPLPPVITITEPLETVTSFPMIHVKGSSDEPLKTVRFDVINQIRRVLNEQGLVTGSFFDTALWQRTSNSFQCFDVDLAPGTNVITVRCEDYMGRVTTKVLTNVLRLDLDKTPPRVSIQWPTPEGKVSGEYFTVRGQIDDATAQVNGRISSEGRRGVTVPGIIERKGRFWIEDLPLLANTNLLTITATDAAGNSTTTNVTIFRSQSSLNINPVPLSQLWQLQVTVTGNVFPPHQKVWLNGRPASVEPDGKWRVTGVPLDTDGVAIFEAVAIPADQSGKPFFPHVEPALATVQPKESAVVAQSLRTNAIVLNANQPTYGTFKLHLTGVAGRTFVISASTNLIDWVPVLTNSSTADAFDYLDTNVSAYGCRFFRVTPIP